MKILPNECSTHVLTKATSALGQNLSNRFSNIIGKMMRVQKKFASCPHYVIQHIDRDDEEKYCQNILYYFSKTSANNSKKNLLHTDKRKNALSLKYQLAT